jgi:hypothetical protein
VRVFPGETVVWRFEVSGAVTELDIGFQVGACRYRDGVRGPQKPLAWTGLDRTVPLLPPSDPKQQCRYGRDGLSVNGYWACTPSSTVAAAGGGAGGGGGGGAGGGAAEAAVPGLPTIKEEEKKDRSNRKNRPPLVKTGARPPLVKTGAVKAAKTPKTVAAPAAGFVSASAVAAGGNGLAPAGGAAAAAGKAGDGGGAAEQTADAAEADGANEAQPAEAGKAAEEGADKPAKPAPPGGDRLAAKSVSVNLSPAAPPTPATAASAGRKPSRKKMVRGSDDASIFLVLAWDNSFSRWRGKQVKYKISVYASPPLEAQPEAAPAPGLEAANWEAAGGGAVAAAAAAATPPQPPAAEQ